MNDRNIPITEDELHAYVDDELPAERRADVEAWLATHPEDAGRVQSWRAMAEMLHARYDSVAQEQVPARLYGAVAAALVAFVAGGTAGWVAHGAANAPSTFQSFTADALDAHRLYVVEVRHPVEVGGNERDHLQAWLTRRCGWTVFAPNLEASGLKLVGGRLLPGPSGPASFLMYEGASGERYTIYTAKTENGATQMRYAKADKDGALFWAERGVGYVVSGGGDRDRLTKVAQAVYDQAEKNGG